MGSGINSVPSSFKVLSTDTSFITIAVCYRKLSSLEFSFHYYTASELLRVSRASLKPSRGLGTRPLHELKFSFKPELSVLDFLWVARLARET